MTIETARLRLRPFVAEDLDDALAVLGSTETMDFYPRPYTRTEVADMLRASIESLRDHGIGRYAVLLADGRYIGDCGITIQQIDGVPEREVGYRIGKPHWGNGYAHEAAAAVVKHGFEQLGLSRLCSYMPENHHQSRRVAEKLGMRLEKTYPNARNRGIMTCVYAVGRGAHAQPQPSTGSMTG